MKGTLFILSFFCLALNLCGQDEAPYYPSPAHPEWFKAIPLLDSNTPDWAKTMYEEDNNFHKVNKLRKSYYESNPFVKNIHTQNYKYWLKIIQDHIGDNGKAKLPKPGTEFRAAEKNKRTSSRKSMTNSWTNIGPNKTYLSDGSLNLRPTQANVYCLAVSPSNTSVLYAGMETGGIFKSIDKGLTWTPSSYSYAIGNIQDIKVDPNDSNIVLIARGSEVYKTTDGGVTWALNFVAAGIVEQFIYINSNVIYAATRAGLYKSTNSGGSWSINYSGYIYDIEAKPGSSDTLYISTLNNSAIRPEVFKTTNAGSTWSLMDNGFYTPTDLSVATVYGCKIGVTPADPNRLYAGIIATGKTNDNGWIGVYYSLDEGVTWQEDSGFDGAPYASGNDASTNWYVGGYSNGYHQGWYNFDIDVSHSNPDRLWIGTIWFCESSNKGGNIEYIRGTRSLEMHADIQDIDVVGSDIWIASDGGINYSSDECQTVETRMNGITASDFWGFGQGWNEDIWVGGRYHNGNVASHENYGVGNTVFLGGAETATGYVNQLDNRKAYFSDIGDKKISTTLSDPVSSIANLGMYPTQSYFDFSYSEVEWDPRSANNLFLGKDDKLFKSTDGGVNFTDIYQFPGDIRRFEISRDDPQYIYAIIYHSYWDWRVHKSTDNGKTFTEVNTPAYSGGSWRNLSFTLNPFDKNEIWLASNSSSDGNKIYSSTDGGLTWANRYSPIIAGEGIKDMIYQSNANGNKVYTMTNDNFFYYDVTQNLWVSFNQDLPVQHSGFKILPFYRDNKIRMASAKGIWEVEFEDESSLQARAMAAQDSVFCARDTVYLDSYSIGNNNGMTYQWTITPAPIWTSDLTTRNPKVVFGADGDYSIDLTISANGNSSVSTNPNMINVTSQCTSEFIPGKALTLDTDGEYMQVSEANLTNLSHFSVTGWWKPDGAQSGFAALFSSGDWCAHCDYTEGLIVDYFGSRLWYKWPGNVANWGSNSGMVIPLDEWSYVALVIEPTKATLYLNEEKYVHNIALSPGEFNDLYIGYGHYSKSFKGDIDEVTIWKKALTEDEVRLMRHLTKEDQILTEPDLIAYYQFNDLLGGTQIMDKARTLHGTIHPDAVLSESQAPIGTGSSHIENIVAGSGTIDFPGTGVSIDFNSNGTAPEGDVVVSRINIQPDILPTGNPDVDGYWIINNYGTNPVFLPLAGITFSGVNNSANSTMPSDFALHQRLQNAFASAWTFNNNADALDSNAQAISFSSNVNITTFGQFVIAAPEADTWIGVVDNDWHNPSNWASGAIPTSSSNVIIPAGTPFHPIVNANATIRLLCVAEGAAFMVNIGVDFQVTD